MKYTYIKQIIISSLATLLLVSCEGFKEDLDQVNPNVISTDSFWKNLNDVESTLTATYASLYDENLYLIREESIRTDMAYPGLTRPGITSQPDMVAFHEHSFNNTTPTIETKWNACYLGVFRANQTIEALNSLENFGDNEERWTQLMAEARFLRGLFYFYLHSAFNEGNVILHTVVPKTDEDFFKELSDSDTVKTFFREDLIFAYENLPIRPDQSIINRASKGAAGMVLANSYMYDINKGDIADTETYDKAAPILDEIINGMGYSLEQDLTKIFTQNSEFNSESIFEINYDNTIRQDILSLPNGNFRPENLVNSLSFFSSYRTFVSGFIPPIWIIHDYKNEFMDPNDSRNIKVDDDGNPILDDEGNEQLRSVSLRCSQMIAVVNDDDSKVYGDKIAGIVPVMFNGPRAGIGFYKKYTNHDLDIEQENNLPGGQFNSGKNIVLYRLPEALLLRSEIHIHKGEIAEAKGLIDIIRSRWGLLKLDDLGAVDMNDYNDPTTLMNHLMFVEKALELSIEGCQTRFQDLKRWGVLFDRIDDLSNRVYYGAGFPIPNPDPTGTPRSFGNRASDISLTKNFDGEPDGDSKLIYDKEYDNGAARLNSLRGISSEESKVLYYPIPFEETQINNKLN